MSSSDRAPRTDPHGANVDVVRFRLVGGEQPLAMLPIDVMGQGPRPFILDTGAARTMVDAAVARTLGLAAHDRREGRGIAGAVAVELMRVPSIAIGARTLSDFEVVATDLSALAARIGGRVDGVLGHDVFGAARLVVDYRGLQVRLEWAPEAPQPEAGAVDLPFELAGERKPLVMVPVMVNEAGPFRFAVDTGASTTLVTAAVAARAGIERGASDWVTGGGGGLGVHLARARRIGVGSLGYESVDVMIADLAGLAAVVGTIDGILGYNVLRSARVTFDYPAGILRLAPH